MPRIQLISEIKELISKNYNSVNVDTLHQLTSKLLELAQEYLPSLTK